MPITPNPLERLILLHLNLGPGVMLDFLGAQAFRAVCVAVRLGIFEALDGHALAPAEVARRIEADERGTTLLLEALETLGYLTRTGERFANSATSSRWLSERSPTSLACGIPLFESMVFDRWGHLEASIRRGRPALHGSEWLDQHPDGGRIYQQGMIAVARVASEEVIKKARLPASARRLLDLGGGHGLYSARFCRRYPRLTATVFDLPPVKEVALETIAAEGMGDRVRFQPGDFWVDELGDDYDVILLFNVLHTFSPEKNLELLSRASRALNRGARAVIMEQIPGRTFGSVAEALARLQALNFFNDEDARTYAFDEIAGWLERSGFSGARRIDLPRTPGFSLIVATKAATTGDAEPQRESRTR